MKNFTLFLLFFCQVTNSQNISGHIYDIKTKEPLPGATIYVDGTSLGTSSDFEGYFKLDIEHSQNANIIVSFLGYETRVFTYLELDSNLPIYLTESTNQLNEIELGFDLWSREKKMGIFKREFLGKEFSSTQCKILNEKDIILIHNSSQNTLVAFADRPILIKNKHLGYEVSYDLHDFEIDFIYNLQGLFLINKVYYAGTSFFKELKKKQKNKILENRETTYFGSLIHFMRSLSSGDLASNNFGIYHNSLPTNPNLHFKLSKENDFTKVTMTTDRLSIFYNKIDQSSIEQNKEDQLSFYIDVTGNHSPPDALIFSGVLAQKRISSMLPLNYISSRN